MLSSKQRLLAISLATMAFIVPVIMNQIAILLNLPTNPTDIKLFQTTTTIRYQYEDGTYEHSTTLTVEIDASDLTTATVISTLGAEVRNWEVDYTTGKEKSTGKYSLFWVFITNPMLSIGQLDTTQEYEVVDPIGIITPDDTTTVYTLRFGERKVYWDVNPELAGAQFSLEYHIYNPAGREVATGLMDSTCGFLSTFYGGDNNAKLTITSPGSFAISRNRMNFFFWGIVFGIAMPIGIFIYMKKKEYDDDLTEEFILIMTTGIIATLIDIDIDVWFYAWFGMTGMLLIHIGAAVVFGLICWRLKYGAKWATIGLIEVAFVFAMNFAVGDPYVPHLTANMGLFLTFFAMLYRSGLGERDYKDKLDFII